MKLTTVTLLITILMLGWAVVSIYQDSNGTITNVPTTTWAPIVNPLPGKVGGVYQINVGTGVSCFLYKGDIVDDFSCVRVLP